MTIENSITKMQITAPSDDCEFTPAELPAKQTVNETIADLAMAANDEQTSFEVELFTSGEVDFENYVDPDSLFEKLKAQVQSNVEPGFANYQQSLLEVLQHCYGYFYLLKTDTDRFNNDIKKIDTAIRGYNRNSNKSNSLSSKIVKLAWQGTVDRRRISDYAKLIDIAWKKGDYEEHVTDAKGRLLPSHFVNEVTLGGGINRFTRDSTTKETAALQTSGYKSKEATKIEWARTAIREASFEKKGKPITIRNTESIPCDRECFGENEPVLLLGRYNKNKREIEISFIPEATRAQELFERPMEQALVAFYDCVML